MFLLESFALLYNSIYIFWYIVHFLILSKNSVVSIEYVAYYVNQQWVVLRSMLPIIPIWVLFH